MVATGRGPGSKLRFSGIGKLIRIGYQECQLPYLCIVQYALKGRHSGQADPILDFPIAFLRRIVRNAFPFEHQRRVGKHVLGDGRGRLIRQTVATGALILVELGALPQNYLHWFGSGVPEYWPYRYGR